MAQKRSGRKSPRRKRPTKQQQHTLSWVGALFVVFASLAFSEPCLLMFSDWLLVIAF